MQGLFSMKAFSMTPSAGWKMKDGMEMELHERFGEFGLGKDYDKDLPQIGAVHLAAGYLLSEMLGCSIDYIPNAAPQVICPHLEGFELDEEKPFQKPGFQKAAKTN